MLPRSEEKNVLPVDQPLSQSYLSEKYVHQSPNPPPCIEECILLSQNQLNKQNQIEMDLIGKEGNWRDWIENDCNRMS